MWGVRRGVQAPNSRDFGIWVIVHVVHGQVYEP